MKFGGTSVADLDRIRHVAKRVQAERARGNRVAVVVSAMAGVTNQMVGFCHDLDPLAPAAEADAVVASGEQVTSGLLAIALNNLGVPSRSFQGWQVALHTDTAYGHAAIESVDGEAVLASLQKNEVPVMAGFQGLSPEGRIATLGRGGSDTSAVALAAAIGAARCDIYTDVDGVYTSDPRIVKNAQRLRHVAYEEMLELASGGAKVLQTRSVGLAMRERVLVRVLSSFSDVEPGRDTGTVVADEDASVEKKLVTGIAYSIDEAKFTLSRVPDQPGVAGRLFKALSEAAINIDMIVQAIGEDGTTNLTFTAARSDEARTIRLLEELRAEIPYGALLSSRNVAKISVVGVGMRSNPGVAATMFSTLAERGINVQVISTSEIKVSVLIDAEYAELAMRALHTAYGLDGPAEGAA
ncbi:aspartate kinase [Formicincola oecophyllae]|nr:aspartate kinase [Formicincola oecophyllae]